MTTLIPVGFFRELPHGAPDGPSLREAVRKEAAPEEARLAAYLEAGALLAASPGVCFDVLKEGGGGPPIGSPDLLTDGRYAWPGDLAHYVRGYHAALPADFVRHAEARGYQVPADLDVSDLSL